MRTQYQAVMISADGQDFVREYCCNSKRAVWDIVENHRWIFYPLVFVTKYGNHVQDKRISDVPENFPSYFIGMKIKDVMKFIQENQFVEVV